MESSATSRTHRKLCVNCNICVNTLRRRHVLQLDPKVVTLISGWITPVIITEEDFICEPCLELARQAVNSTLHGCDASDKPLSSGSDIAAGPQRLGHTQVCLVCGRSLRRRQSHLVLQQNPSRLLKAMINIFASRIAPRQISDTSRVCHPCWLRIERAANRSFQIDNRSAAENQPAALIVEPENPPVQHLQITQRNIEHNIRPQQQDLHVERERENRPQSQDHQENSRITLPNYRRAANTASHCVITGCDRLKDLHTVSDTLRAKILSGYNYYIPKLARVCSEHLHINNWNVIYDSPNSMNTFTVDQVEHIFSFVKASKP